MGKGCTRRMTNGRCLFQTFAAWRREGSHPSGAEVRRFALAGLLALSLGSLGGCIPVDSALAISSTAPQTPQESAFSADKAEHVLSYTFDVITERYLEPITSQQIALSALRGLRSLDPTLDAAVNGRTLVVTLGERVIASQPAPAADDGDDWAETTVAILSALRPLSPAIAKADNEALYTAMLGDALPHLDTYSRYAGFDEAGRHRDNRNGFGGVGIRYQIEGGFLNIEEVIPETPAATAGLKPGDKVTRIDGIEVALLGEQREGIRERLRGPIDSELRLTILRTNREQDIFLRRGLVLPRTAFLDNTDSGIAQIRLTGFNQQTAKGVQQAITEAKTKLGAELRGVLLDLRGNPGGLLDQAVEISDLFLTRGRIVFTKGRHSESLQSYSASASDIADGLPMVVLIDGRSASAAEILAAALQDNGRAVLVGSSSYGKGTVQTVIRLPNDGEMTLTWSRFHAPSGYALHGLGVLPTICVTNQAEAPAEAISRALSPTLQVGGASMAAHMAEWRSTPLWDEKARGHLRQICPPTDEEKWPATLGIARELLSNHGLFARALAIASPQSALR